MAELLVLYLHLLAALYAFTQRWQERGLREGILAVLLVGMVFLLVWTLSGALVRLLIAQPKLTPWLTRDGLGLLLPLPLELWLFRALFLRPSAPPHTQPMAAPSASAPTVPNEHGEQHST
jgi:hypothetical protein